MTRLPLVLLSLIASTVAQDGEREARVLRRFIRAQIDARPERRVLVSIIANTSDTTADALGQRLRATALAIVPLTVSLAARPGGDTLYLRVTHPVHDSLDYYRFGVERLSCLDGQLHLARAIVRLRCNADTCGDYSESPIVDPEWVLGGCKRP